MFAHPLEAESIDKVDRTIEPGDTLDVGGLHVETLHTPGHTAGMLNFVINGDDVFTGDTLFKGSVGGVRAPGSHELRRPQALDHGSADEAAAETRVQPGHTDPTTIGDEWEGNAFVRLWRGLDEEGDEPCRVWGERGHARALGARLRRRAQGLGALARRQRRHRPGQPGRARLTVAIAYGVRAGGGLCARADGRVVDLSHVAGSLDELMARGPAAWAPRARRPRARRPGPGHAVHGRRLRRLLLVASITRATSGGCSGPTTSRSSPTGCICRSATTAARARSCRAGRRCAAPPVSAAPVTSGPRGRSTSSSSSASSSAWRATARCRSSARSTTSSASSCSTTGRRATSRAGRPVRSGRCSASRSRRRCPVGGPDRRASLPARRRASRRTPSRCPTCASRPGPSTSRSRSSSTAR